MSLPDATPDPAPPVPRRLRARDLGRLLAALAGAAGAISLALACVGPPVSPFLLASLGGSTVFLFGLTRAPAAQPRALLGGHLIGAAIGIACYQGWGDALWVYALAQCLTLAAMLLTGTVHPPAGANPLLMVHAHASWSALWSPVLLGVACLGLFAMVWSRLVPGHVHYPVRLLERSPPSLRVGGLGRLNAFKETCLDPALSPRPERLRRPPAPRALARCCPGGGAVRAEL